MNEYRRKLIAYIDFLKRRGTGHTWCDEHPHFRHFEKNELGEILDRAFTPTPTKHSDTVRLRTAIVGLQAIEAETMNILASIHARACLAAIDAVKEAERG